MPIIQGRWDWNLSLRGNNGMKTGIIGFGNMGKALAHGLASAGIKPKICEVVTEKALEATLQGFTICSVDEIASLSDILVIAVKPQELPKLLDSLGKHTAGKGIVSIAAGKKISLFEKRLGTSNVARFMPNLAASLAMSAVAVSYGEKAEESFRNDALAIARAVGTAFEIPEKLMSAFTGLSGSGIAYVFSFINALAMGGVEAGIKYDDALAIALATTEGAVAVLRSQKVHPSEMVSRVASPGGTTIEGIHVLEDAGFNASVMKAVIAAARKAELLENDWK